jgi:hypothetical protein
MSDSTPQTEIPIGRMERAERADYHYAAARTLMAQAMAAMRDGNLPAEQVALLLDAAKVEATLAGAVRVTMVATAPRRG